jgi:hypothetical protein
VPIDPCRGSTRQEDEMGISTPARSVEQRQSALQTANRVRMYLCGLKKELHDAGHDEAMLYVIGQIQCPMQMLRTMRVCDLIQAVPKMGWTKTSLAMDRAGVAPSKTLAGLTSRQREALVAHLPVPVQESVAA